MLIGSLVTCSVVVSADMFTPSFVLAPVLALVL